MANRRIEMHEYQEALYRMRQGQTDRAISRDRVLGRRKSAALRQAAAEQGWLDEGAPMPTPAQIVALVASRVEDGGLRGSSPVSSVAPYADRIKAWFDEGVQGVAIHVSRNPIIPSCRKRIFPTHQRGRRSQMEGEKLMAVDLGVPFRFPYPRWVRRNK